MNPPTQAFRLTLVITAMTALTQAGLVLYTPAFEKIAHAFSLSHTQMKGTMTSYLFTFGLSQLFYGPLSDRYGRKPLFLLGMSIFSIGSLYTLFTTTYTELLVSRAIQGFGVGACVSLSRCLLKDSFEGVEYFKRASYLSAGFAIGLGITPVLGSLLLKFFSWKADFVLLFILGALLFFSVAFFIQETHTKEKRALLKGNSPSFYKCFITCFSTPQFSGYLLGGTFCYGVVITYTTMTPLLFQTQLFVSPSTYGWLTLVLGVFYYFGTYLNRKLLEKVGVFTLLKISIAVIFVSGLAMGLSKVVFGVFNLWVTMLPFLVATCAQALVWSNCIAGALKDLGNASGKATSIFSCVQMVTVALLSAILSLPIEKNQLPSSLSILALAILSFLVFHFLVFKRSAPPSTT